MPPNANLVLRSCTRLSATVAIGTVLATYPVNAVRGWQRGLILLAWDLLVRLVRKRQLLARSPWSSWGSTASNTHVSWATPLVLLRGRG